MAYNGDVYACIHADTYTWFGQHSEDRNRLVVVHHVFGACCQYPGHSVQGVTDSKLRGLTTWRLAHALVGDLLPCAARLKGHCMLVEYIWSTQCAFRIRPSWEHVSVHPRQVCTHPRTLTTSVSRVTTESCG